MLLLTGSSHILIQDLRIADHEELFVSHSCLSFEELKLECKIKLKSNRFRKNYSSIDVLCVHI